MSRTVDHAVAWLNRLNVGLQVIETKMHRIARRDPESPEFLGLIAASFEAHSARERYRQLVAADVAPWFDASAFARAG